MKKIVLAVAAIAATIVFALPSFAEDTKTATPKSHETTGVITALDATKASLTIKHKDAEKTFAVTGKAVEKLASLKVGEKVTVTYTENAGVFTASKIKVKSAEEKPAAPAPASTK